MKKLLLVLSLFLVSFGAFAEMNLYQHIGATNLAYEYAKNTHKNDDISISMGCQYMDNIPIPLIAMVNINVGDKKIVLNTKELDKDPIGGFLYDVLAEIDNLYKSYGQAYDWSIVQVIIIDKTGFSISTK